MVIARALKHLFTPHWVALRAFPPPVLAKIEQAVKSSERAHRGEIRFAVEGPLHLAHLRLSTRERARQMFGELGVWDTAENSGVLIYVQLVDRRIEIVADRGIATKVAQAEWEAICRTMERSESRNDMPGRSATEHCVTPSMRYSTGSSHVMTFFVSSTSRCNEA